MRERVGTLLGVPGFKISFVDDVLAPSCPLRSSQESRACVPPGRERSPGYGCAGYLYTPLHQAAAIRACACARDVQGVTPGGARETPTSQQPGRTRVVSYTLTSS